MLKSPICILLIFLLSYASWAQTDSLDFDPLRADIATIQEGYARGAWSIHEITSVYLQRIEQMNQQGPDLGAILSLNPQALAIADSLDQMYRAGHILGPLHGIPIILKDNIESRDSMPTTAGSRALAANYSGRDATLTARLRAAGAIILAKANLSEWANFRGARSISGWSAIGGFTRNPYILTRNPCGSSSGSAVAVAAGLAPVAIGTETNGSIICPSQSNGLVGLKPSVGLVPGKGIIPIAHSQDAAGPIAKTVQDAALILSVIADPDTNNPARFSQWDKLLTPKERLQFQKLNIDSLDLSSMRIGVYSQALGEDQRVDELFDQAKALLQNKGVEFVEISSILAPETNYASFEVMLYEFHLGLNAYLSSLDSSLPVHNLEELIAFNKADSIELQWFGQEYLEMALEKDSSQQENYLRHLNKMQRNSRELGIDLIMDSLKLDAIIAPSGAPAWITDPVNGDHYILGSSSPAAISGYPNISLPMGMIQGLPVGLSIFGRLRSELLLLQIAAAYEAERKAIEPPKFLGSDPLPKN